MGYLTNRTHQPVMLSEMLSLLQPGDSKVYLDCTFGGGGYSRAILASAECRVIALDQDAEVQEEADDITKEFAPRFHFVRDNFANLLQILASLKINKLDGIVVDLGVSMMQLVDPQRGFSFNSDTYLDMRMDQSKGPTAAELISQASEQVLADVIYYFGGEHAARTIARNIISTRKTSPITTTAQLAQVVRKSRGGSRIDPATKTFQAVRIWVNGEMESLQRLLEQCSKALNIGGKLIILSFHSEEDRIVKRYLTSHQIKRKPRSEEPKQGIYDLLNKKPLIASYQEVRANPAARSAKLRGAVKSHEEEICD